MIKEILAKVLLSSVKQPDPWFGLKYNMNLYRGCQHQCIYCDSRSKCYRIENFEDILVKANAIELLATELATKRVKGTIGTGSMNDPYMPVEARRNLTGQALKLIADFGFPVHVITKSGLVLKDLNTLQAIARVYAAVSFSISNCDDDLAAKLEPVASPVSERFAAMERLASRGIYTGVILMPLLPFLGDNEENISAIVKRAADSGAGYIIPSFGMTMRDRQRSYFYDKLDELFPGLRPRYEELYGDEYHCSVPTAGRLSQVFEEACDKVGIATAIKPWSNNDAPQLGLF
ncbi:MAG: radical SAM protein [bacterium]|nr:radical SAM protein [bacterium]